MTGNELIDRINKTKLGNCEISINFSLNGNGSYVVPILNIIPECTDLNLFIDIGQIDEIIANDIKLINSNCNITPVSKAKRAVKRSSNATAYNEGYCKGYEDALIDTGKSV
jgi:hypothetical protein